MIDSYHDAARASNSASTRWCKARPILYDDNNEDPTWDGICDVATKITPRLGRGISRSLQSAGFGSSPDHTFGLLCARCGPYQRAHQLAAHDNDKQVYISQLGELSGIRDLAAVRRLEVVPYVVTKNETRPTASSFNHPQSLSAGADIKYGLSSNLTLDATINPDFGQVEADPAVLNLSAFEQFFEERRPFFLEGAGIFSFRTACGDIDTQCTGPFYSRRVGISPQLAGVYGDASSPTNTTI